MADDYMKYVDPRAYQQSKQAQDMANALAYSKLNPNERTAMAGYQFGGALGKTAGGLFGIKDRDLEEVTAANEIMKGVDRNDFKALYQKANELGQAGLMKAGEAVWKQAQELEKRDADLKATKAKTSYEEARASTAGLEKKSTADVAQIKERISQLEQDILDGKPISAKDLAYARAGLVQLKQGKSYLDKDGRVIQIPGIDPYEYAPGVAAKVFGKGATAPSSTWNTSNPTATLQAIATIQDPEEQKAALASFTQALQQGTTAPALPTQPSGGIKVTELPASAATIKAEQEKAQNTVNSLNTALSNVDTALQRVNPWSTGWGSALLKKIPTSDAMALNDIVTSLKSESVFAQLQALKEQSKTGASGLGSVTEKEIGLLEARIRSLNPESKTFVEDLKFIQKQWQELKAKAQAKASPKINWEASVNNIMTKYGVSRAQAEQALKDKGINP